jgi:hypothetical protein
MISLKHKPTNPNQSLKAHHEKERIRLKIAGLDKPQGDLIVASGPRSRCSASLIQEGDRK